MSISERGLNRATLARQMLLERARIPAPEAVRRLVGLQAQAPATPYLAIWNRVAGFDGDSLDEAFLSGTLVKATLLRITLHAVHADDHPLLHRAVLPVLRGARLGDTRFTRSGLTVADADALLPELIDFAARSRTPAEIEAMLAARLGGERPGAWWALRTFAALHHTPTGGPWSFASRAFHAAPVPGSAFHAAPVPASSLESSRVAPVPALSLESSRVAPDPVLSVESSRAVPGSGLSAEPSRDEAIQRLVLRYLTAFGPATIADIRQFTLIPAADLRAAVLALGDQLSHLPGNRLYDVPGAPLPPEDAPAPPRLLPMWDSILLAYADRSRVIPPGYRRLVIRMNGDVLPTLLVDGYVAGVWRAVPGGIEATAFHPLSRRVWDALAAEAASLSAFLTAREPLVYSRYAHWWSKPLPAAEVRLLPAYP
ncbi:winged helix DNA-binding domain-containing protein [Actinoplanes rectilineatus]|uniref:winged helix DNA-binding domain-containing protein n=1 Tax=Actinoplanes rectilineatus TaxID=113571 RepID=UPI0005F2822D|nr:winged helix DNA-binding domain-containing protein [Actinoplanes rectilineatus]